MTTALTLVCDGSSTLDRQSVVAAIPGESIVGSTLEQVLPPAIERCEERSVDKVAIVTAETVNRASVEARLEAAGVTAVGWVDARLGAGLSAPKRGRVVAAAIQARLSLAAAGNHPAALEATAKPNIDRGEVVVVDAPGVAADLATHVPVTLLTSEPGQRRRRNVTVREGRPLEVFDDGDLTLLVECPGGADRLRADHLVWPGYDGDVDSDRLYVDSSGVVDALVRVACEHGRDPVTVDQVTCAVGQKGTPGCRACEAVCPYDAVSIDSTGAGSVTIDPHACTDCGVCLGACPTESISSPRAASLDVLADATGAALEVTTTAEDGFSLPFVGRDEPETPPVLAFTTHDLEPVVVTAHSETVPTIPIPVTDARRVPAALVLYALAAGAGGVLLVGDPERSTDALEQTSEETARTLEALGLEPAVSWVASTEPAAVRGALERVHVDERLTDRPLSRLSTETDSRPRTPATDGGVTVTAASLSVHAINALASEPRVDVPTPALGSVVVEAADCTLCWACDGMCPTGALEQPDEQTLRFDPSACVGCERCVACPEDAIEVTQTVSVPLGTQEPVVEHEPVTCVSCGDAFGSATGLAQVRDALSDADLTEGLGLESCPDCRRQGISSGGTNR